MSNDDPIDLALQHIGTGQPDEAVRIVARVLASEPRNADAMCVLAIAGHAQGDVVAARRHVEAAIAIDPESAWYRVVLGEVLATTDPSGAIGAFSEALRLQPDSLEAARALATLLAHARQWDEAVTAYRRWLELSPGDPAALHGVAVSLIGAGKSADALAIARQLAQQHPNDAGAWNLLGKALHTAQAYDDASDAYARAVDLNLQDAESRYHLGHLLASRGEVGRGIDSWRAALRLLPHHHALHSTIVYHLNYDAALSPKQVFDEHVRWAETFAEPITRIATRDHANDRDPDRPIRVGYVSPDFLNHPVTAFVEPILAAHRKEQVVSVCLHDSAKSDAYTERLRSLAHDWHAVAGLSDEQVAQRVRDLKIDVLVDLAGHLPHNRLLAFARWSAPVQITYLGYCNTTGMSAIDYTFVDDVTDPPDDTQPYSERLIRLPHGFACFAPKRTAPEPNALPATAAGYVTFGVFHRPHKLNDGELALLARVLREVPGARMLFWRDLLFGRAADRVREAMRSLDIDASRYTIRGDPPPTGTHLGIFHACDVALDAQPWSGHTTACESTWMGVPYVTMLGRTHAGRMAASALIHAGCGGFVAKDADEYVAIAKRLAGDADGLARLRRELRPRMAASDLCNAARFTASVEDELRTVWRAWCSR